MIVTVEPIVFKEALKIMQSFYKKSNIYYYGNYTRIRVFDNTLELSQVQIIGEAINTGIFKANVPILSKTQEDLIDIQVPTEEWKKIVSKLTDANTIIIFDPNSIVIQNGSLTAQLPTIDLDYVQSLYDSHDKIKNEGKESSIHFPALKSAIELLEDATKGEILNYDHMAYFLYKDRVAINRGARSSMYIASNLFKEDEEAMVFPVFMSPVVKKFDNFTKCKRDKDSQGNPIVYFESGIYEVHFQEWRIAEDFPIDKVAYLFDTIAPSIQPAVSLEEYREPLLSLYNQQDPLIYLDLNNGLIYKKNKTLEIEVPPVYGAPLVVLSSQMLPRSKELKKLDTMRIASNMVVFSGEYDTAVATYEVEE